MLAIRLLAISLWCSIIISCAHSINVAPSKINSTSTQNKYELKVQLNHSDAIDCIAVSPDGKFTASAAKDKRLKIWDNNGMILQDINTNVIVKKIAFTLDSKKIVLISEDKLLIANLENSVTTEIKGDFDSDYKNRDPYMTLSPDTKFGIAAYGSKAFLLFSTDGSYQKIIGSVERVPGTEIFAAFSPDSKLVIIPGGHSKYKSAIVYDMNGSIVNQITSEYDWSDGFETASFSKNGKFIVLTRPGIEDNDHLYTTFIYNINGSLYKKIDNIGEEIYKKGGGNLNKADGKGAWLLNNDSFLITSHSKKMFDSDVESYETRLIDLRNGKSLSIIDGKVMAMDNERKILLTGKANYNRDTGSVKNGFLQLWSIDGNRLTEIQMEDNAVAFALNFTGVKLSQSRKRIIARLANNKMKIWDMNGKILFNKVTYSNKFAAIDLSANDAELLQGNKNNLEIINIASGEKRGEPSFSTVNSIDICPDNKFIVSGHSDKKIRIWSTDGNLVKNIDAHDDGVHSVSFSADGKRIVSGSTDNTIKIWSIDGRLLKSITNDKYILNSVRFSPDGEYIVSASGDHSRDTKKADPLRLLTHFGKINLYDTNGQFIRKIKEWSGDMFDVGIPFEVYFGKDSQSIMARLSYYNVDTRGNIFRTFNEQALWNLDGKLLKHKFDDAREKFAWRDKESWEYSDRSSFDKKWMATAVIGDAVSMPERDNLGPKIKLIGVNNSLVLEGHSGVVNAVKFSRDGQYLVSAGGDGLIKLWKLASGDSLTLASVGNKWVSFTKEGYFDSSNDGGELLKIVKNNKIFSVDQFAARLNRPDIILSKIGIASGDRIEHYKNQYLKRMRRLKLTESKELFDFKVPEASIVDFKQEGKFADLRFVLNDPNYELRRYNIYVNDIPLFGAGGKEIRTKTMNANERIELIEGRNKIEINCVNETGSESFRALAYADYSGKGKNDLYYIGFGVSRYKDKTLNLLYADKDASDIGALLSKAQANYYDKVHTNVYLNDEVTVDNIVKAKEILKNAKPDDTVVLFIAGHGVHDNDQESTYYYLTHNSDIANLPQTSANFELIEDILQGIPSRKKLFLMDTCESGEVEDKVQDLLFAEAKTKGFQARTTRGLSVKLKEENKQSLKVDDKQANNKRTYLFEKDRYIYNDLLRRTGAIVFSGSKGGEFSYEPKSYKKDENGFFTKEILNALRGKDASNATRNAISIDNLRKYVTMKVSQKSAGLQNPTVDRDNIYQKFSLPVITEPLPP